MKAFLAAGVAAAALACLAGCDGPADASTPVNPMMASLPVNMPVAPAGLWSYMHEINGAPAYSEERCRMSEDTLAEIAMINTPPALGCARSFIEKGEGWEMHMACGGGEKSIAVDTVVTGDFAKGYDVDATRVSGPGVDVFTSQKMTLHAKRLGDC
ncbi:MAG TPA: DUF3617 family protein [Hyphomonadaceae bacterium]|jgi:hypothetical protein|nr:DUF3617 family protein [Hyphomonadaceae bacterium]